ncbi:hypothetical protein KIN20_022003 [Parelaphostrongylus tenuis]|uniref:Uncharacterized protein n=1 Tax=Parelaphostrongylus tenuis TaxID=148309 RepID=A0AAD5QRY9_PARTN|nr:hypothetical protein KIN20_022003 [Parelaphostrongylus tenuis]
MRRFWIRARKAQFTIKASLSGNGAATSGEQVQEVAEISEPNKATNIEQAKNVKLEDKFPRFIAAPATANCPPHSAPISTFCTGLHT